MRTFSRWIITGVLLSSCGGSPPVQPVESPPAAEPTTAEEAPAPEAPPIPTPTEATTPTDGTESVVARILESGPSGSGQCDQRSYRVERTDEAGAQPFWVHFEHCQGTPPPGFNGTGLSIGETYRFRLRRGGSANFGDDPMILGADSL